MADSPHERRIISIASAPGWAALLSEGEDPFAEPRLVTLAAWALVEGGEGQSKLVGLVQTSKGEDGGFDFADEIDGFAGYSNQGLKTKRAD